MECTHTQWFPPAGSNCHIVHAEADMNIQQPTHMDKSAFLAWAQGREGRFELAESKPIR